VSFANTKSPAELFDDFIKLEWQDVFRHEVDVRLDSGARYVPNGGARGVQLLRKNVNAFDEAIRIWSGPTGDPDSGTQGYDRIVDRAGIDYTWEGFLIDRSRPWAGEVPPLVRKRIEADLDQRDRNSAGHREARARAAWQRAEEEADAAEKLAVQEDLRLISVMNASRTEQGRELLTEQQVAAVLENCSRRRAVKRQTAKPSTAVA